MKTLTDISNKINTKKEKAEQKRFNRSVEWLIKNIKKGCKKSAKKGLYQYKLYLPDFRKNHKEFALVDLMFCVQIEYLEEAKIKLTSNGEDTLIFSWGKENQSHNE